MNYASKEIETYSPDNLIADSIHPIDTKAVSITTGSETFERGTLINAAGTMCSANEDVPIGILCESVTQSESETPSLIYISGSFNADAVIVGSATSVANFETKLRELGIYLK